MNGRPRLPAAVLALGWVSMCTDLSSEMIVPLLPAFLSAMGAGPAFLGLLEGAANATVALLKGWAGSRSDQTARKPWVVAGYGISGLSRPLIALANAPLAVLLLRLCDRVGKGLRSAPRDALIAAEVPAERRGEAFGVQRAMDHAGAVAGPLLAVALLWLGLSERAVFGLAAVPAAVALLVLIGWVREKPAPAAVAAVPADGGQPRPGFGALLVVTALSSLSHAIDMQLLLRAKEVGVAAVWMPLLWVLLHLVRSGLGRAFGAWSDRGSRRRAIGAGLFSHCVVMLGFGWLASPAWIVPLFALHGLHAAASEGAERGLVADLCHGARRGRAYGRYHLVSGLFALPLAWGFGLLWQEQGANIAFTAAGGLALAAAAVLFLFVPAR